MIQLNAFALALGNTSVVCPVRRVSSMEGSVACS